MINKDILVIEFYEYILNIDKISIDIFAKIWVERNLYKIHKITSISSKNNKNK